MMCLLNSEMLICNITTMSIKYQNGDQVEMIIKTSKESQTGLFTNERLLLIKSGIISYFSSIPKEFIGSYRAVELSGQMPKFTIPANEISKVELNGNELSFLIQKSRLITRDDFKKMVKEEGETLKNRVSKQQNLDYNGYEQWIFKGQNYDSLLEFYRLVNLFRSGNPNFNPNLYSVVEGFQKKNESRRTTIDPSKFAQSHDIAQNRKSEISKPKQHFEVEQKPERKAVVVPVIVPMKEEPRPFKEEIPITKQYEKTRLKEVMQKIVNTNHPYMDTIDEKTNEDQHSLRSRGISEAPIMIQVIKTFEEGESVFIQLKDDPKQTEEAIKKEAGQVIQSLIQEVEQSIEAEQKEEMGPVEPDNTEVVVNIQSKTTEEVIKIEPKKPLDQPKIVEQKRSPSKEDLFNSRFEQYESRVEFQIKERKKKKINQLLKASSFSSNYDYEVIAKSVGMTVEQLKEFISVNSIEQDVCWSFIQNELGKLLSAKLSNEEDKEEIGLVSDAVISEYHNMMSLSKKSQIQDLLNGEMSIQDYQVSRQEVKDVLKWTEQKVNQVSSSIFTSKVISSSSYNISIRPISFSKDQIICSEGSWIVNTGGCLEEFLAYMSLERVIRGISKKEKDNVEIQCGDVIYLKFKEYEAVAKQLKVGYSYYPLKSIRALEFISKSKDILRYQQDFPQFSISVQIIKEGEQYRFHLDRISCPTYRVPSLRHELKRLTFPFENELDLFFESPDYLQLEQKCIANLAQVQSVHKRITDEILFDLFQKIQSNFEVDLICKFVGARIDRQNNLSFQSTALRLVHRQFGQEVALIRRARKRGQIEFSQTLSKKVMSRLQYYQFVTPVSHFIQIYIQLIDLVIIEKGQLHRAVPVLLKVSSFLSQFEIEQYPVYLSLMKTYLKLNQISNFIRILQNCRLFLSQMFGQRSLIFDFPFVRVLIILALRQDAKKGLQMTDNLMKRIYDNEVVNSQIRQRYLSKIIWDKCNILLVLEESYQAFQLCEKQISCLEEGQSSSQNYWIEGVLCLGKCWLEMGEVNVLNSAILQKRVQRAIELSLSRQNFEMAFMLLDLGQKIIQKCRQIKLPRILEALPSFQQAKIEFNATREEMLELITEKE